MIIKPSVFMKRLTNISYNCVLSQNKLAHVCLNKVWGKFYTDSIATVQMTIMVA